MLKKLGQNWVTGRIALSAVVRQRIKKAQSIYASKSSVKTWSNKTPSRVSKKIQNGTKPFVGVQGKHSQSSCCRRGCDLPTARMIILNKEKVLSRAQESQMENRISLGGGLVGSMEFVVARPNREAIVGRIISILEKRDVPKKELQACKIAKKGGQKDKLVLLQLFEKPSPTTRRPNPQEYGNIPDSLLEVIETCKLMWMEAKKIDTIAYIFHIDQVQKGTIFVHGIMDCYFIRNEIRCHYKKSANGLVPNNKSSKLKLKDFQSFQNPYRDGESYSQRMYTLIATANEMVSDQEDNGMEAHGQ